MKPEKNHPDEGQKSANNQRDQDENPRLGQVFENELEEIFQIGKLLHILDGLFEKAIGQVDYLATLVQDLNWSCYIGDLVVADHRRVEIDIAEHIGQTATEHGRTLHHVAWTIGEIVWIAILVDDGRGADGRYRWTLFDAYLPCGTTVHRRECESRPASGKIEIEKILAIFETRAASAN